MKLSPPLQSLKVTFFIFLFTIGHHSFAQVVDKTWIYEKYQHSMEEKIKIAPQDVLEMFLNREDVQVPIPFENHITYRDGEEQNITNTTEAESEISAAINPLDSNNMVVAAMKWTPGLLGATLSFPVYYTHDFGQTWHLSSFADDTTLPDLPAGGGDPVLTFLPNGDLHLSWLIVSINFNFELLFRLKNAISHDGGATWEIYPDPIDVGSSNDSRIIDKEWLAADLSDSEYRGNLYVAYAQIDLTDTTYQILVKTKDAGATDFDTEPVRISPEDMVFAQFTSIDVDREGVVHVVFIGAYLNEETLGLYHTKSMDGGATFSSVTKISDLHIPCFSPDDTGNDCIIAGIDKSRVYSCNHLRVDKSGGEYDGNLYLTWTANGFATQDTGGLDIYFSKSEDGGETWSQPVVVNQDEDGESHNFFSSIWVSPDGKIAISWYDRRNDSNNVLTDYYMTYSADGGASFVADFSLTSSPTDFASIGSQNNDFGVGEYNEMIGTDYYAIPFWANGNENDGNIEIFASFVPLSASGMVGVERISQIKGDLTLNNLYPNPASNFLFVDLSLAHSSEITVEIINSSGQVLKAEKWGALTADQLLKKIDISGLPEAIYQLKMSGNWGTMSTPFVITR